MSDSQVGNAIPIEEAQLRSYRENANVLLTKVSDNVPRTASQQTPAGNHPTLRLDSLSPTKRDVSMYDLAKKASGDARLYTEGVHTCLTAMRKGIELGFCLSELYTKASNLDSLIRDNQGNKLAPERRAELEEKVQTASAITLFVAAYYAYRSIRLFSPEKVDAIMADLPWAPALNYGHPRVAMQSFVFNWGLLIERAADAETDLPFIAMTLRFVRTVLDEVLLRKDSLRYVEPFAANTYRLSGSEFSINGFVADFGNGGPRVEFRKIKFSEIVGNRQAKNFAIRQIDRLICYDPDHKRNPFCDIGGLSTFVLGAGKPGTGKTILGAAMATELERKCALIGLPFAFIPFPGTVISTFQGGSGERAAEWFDKFENPSRINFGLIDDAENVVQNRTDQGVSAGVREVVGEILRRTEGATAIDRGNKSVWLLTNIKEQIDPAVLSRMTERFDIDGAQSEHDFLDQDKLWYEIYNRLDPKFVDLKNPNDYAYFADQAIVKFGKTYEGYDYPRDERICAVVKEVEKLLGPSARKMQRFFALVYQGVQARCPEYNLTSRDVRNIQTSVAVRIMDFDLPELWFEKPEEFFRKEFETKKTMLTDLMKQSLKGLTFSEVRVQEMLRYLDTLAGIRNAGFERAVAQRIEAMRIADAANKRITA